MLTIVENKLVNNENPILVSGYNNTIEVIGKYAKSSVMYCYINGYTTELRFPLIATELTDNGYKFTGSIILHKKCLDYINNNRDKEFYFTFKVNNEPIEGKQTFVIDYESALRYVSKIPDTYTQLLKSINILGAKLDSYINNAIKEEPFNSNNIAPGMIPVSTGSNGSYIWEYPFIKEKEAVKNLTKLLQGISEQLLTINKRLYKVEQSLNDHIYQEYEL